MNMPENEFLLWNQNRWIPICKSDLRRGDVFIARWLKNPKGERVVMRLKAAPQVQPGGMILWDLDFTRGTKEQQQADLPPGQEPLQVHPPPCPRCGGSGIITDNVLTGTSHPCPLCQDNNDDV